MPMMPFIGVRISWLIVARKLLLIRVASWAVSRARPQRFGLQRQRAFGPDCHLLRLPRVFREIERGELLRSHGGRLSLERAIRCLQVLRLNRRWQSWPR